jgi:hypothetical protein
MINFLEFVALNALTLYPCYNLSSFFRCPEKSVLSQFVFDTTSGVATANLYSMFRYKPPTSTPCSGTNRQPLLHVQVQTASLYSMFRYKPPTSTPCSGTDRQPLLHVQVQTAILYSMFRYKPPTSTPCSGTNR